MLRGKEQYSCPPWSDDLGFHSYWVNPEMFYVFFQKFSEIGIQYLLEANWPLGLQDRNWNELLGGKWHVVYEVFSLTRFEFLFGLDQFSACVMR